jgi:hypothetical protein
MSSLGIENSPSVAPEKKKGRWDKLITVGLGLIVAFFSWVIISNGYVLIFQKPLIKLH